MPFTPLHLGPALVLWYFLRDKVNLPTLLVASVIPDIEPLAVVLSGTEKPLHGFLHSLVGGGVMAGALSLAMIGIVNKYSKNSKSEVENIRSVLLASILGVYAHILLDAVMYYDVKPLYPLDFNPLYAGTAAFMPVYFISSILLLIGLFLVLFR